MSKKILDSDGLTELIKDIASKIADKYATKMDSIQYIDVEPGTSINSCLGIPGRTVIYRCTQSQENEPAFTDTPISPWLTTTQGTLIVINFMGAGTIGESPMWVKQIFISGHFGKTFTRYIDGIFISEWQLDEPSANPNLLINPDFKINQRGLSEYNLTNSKSYTVDRWFIYHVEDISDDVINLSITSEGINLTSKSRISQIIENPERFNGKMITFSAKVKSISPVMIRICADRKGISWEECPNIAFNSSKGTGDWEIISQSALLGNDLGILTVVIQSTLADNDFTIEWTKLEVGSVATPFIPPDPATELIKCQRYYATGEYAFDKMTKNINYAIVNAEFPVEMRTKPTVTIYSMLGTVNTISEWASHFDSMESVYVNDADLDTSGFTSITSVNSFVENGAYKFKYTADAEIY